MCGRCGQEATCLLQCPFLRGRLYYYCYVLHSWVFLTTIQCSLTCFWPDSGLKRSFSRFEDLSRKSHVSCHIPQPVRHAQPAPGLNAGVSPDRSARTRCGP